MLLNGALITNDDGTSLTSAMPVPRVYLSHRSRAYNSEEYHTFARRLLGCSHDVRVPLGADSGKHPYGAHGTADEHQHPFDSKTAAGGNSGHPNFEVVIAVATPPTR